MIQKRFFGFMSAHGKRRKIKVVSVIINLAEHRPSASDHDLSGKRSNLSVFQQKLK